VTYHANYGTKVTALTPGTVYYLYRSATANTFVVFDTKHRATLTYANDAAAIAGVGSGNIETSAAADAQLAVVAAGLYSAVSTGSKVVYSNGGGTDATALTNGANYFVYKTSTANTLVIFATKALATATYANDAAAATAGLDIKAGAAGAAHTFTFSADHTFTEAYADACHAQALETSNVVSRSANTDVYHGQQYQKWDAGKIQGCKCDLGYDGPDCSHRISPHGDDPLTTVKSNMMKQAVKIYGKSSATFIREQFLMVYHDPYGGIWRTDAIDGTTNDNIAASRVQDALRALPNEVLEGVKVTGTASTPSICHRFDDGVQHLSAFEDFHIGHHKDAKYASNFCEHSHTELAIANDDMDFTIEFANLPGQSGVQYLFEVDVSKRGAGAFPMSGGITGASTYSVGEINYNANLGNLSELAECSDRGLDDGDGQCECFDGFRGLACEEQEALV
jgi:hypothetical protein